MRLPLPVVKIPWMSASGWVLSLGIHVGIVAMLLLSLEVARTQPRRSVVSFSVVARPTPPQLSPPALEKPLPTPTRPRPRTVAAAMESKPDVKTAAPPSPVDMSGVTLTGNDGAGWSSMMGNGLAMDAPIAPTVVAPSQPKTAEPVPKTATVAPSRPAPLLVPLRELAEKPIPPALNPKLVANYPPFAKRQGIAGKAKVRARIDVDGMVRQASVLSESSEGFGAACRQTLLGSSWSRPRSLTGQAVATEIYYTCDFRVGG